MRFSGNMTQSQIAAEIGISQMHVSRLLAQTLAWLREAMSEDAEPVWPGVAPAHVDDGPTALHLEVQRLPGGTVLVVVAGEVDHDTAPALRTTLCETAIADRPRRAGVEPQLNAVCSTTRSPRPVDANRSTSSSCRTAGRGSSSRTAMCRYRGVCDTVSSNGVPACLTALVTSSLATTLAGAMRW